MKKTTLLIFLLFGAFALAQQGSTAPWMNDLQKRGVTNPTFEEIQAAFNAYWETHDKDAKGSGYKPFKRWEQQYKRRVKADGTIPNGKDFWNAWEAKKKFTQSARRADLSNWQPLGPFNHIQANAQPAGQGRLNAVTIDPNNSNIWYVGSPNGGLWKSTNAGGNWTPMTDNLPRLGVSAIAVDYNDSNIVYIATGDDDADQTPTIGVMKSTDGGATWSTTGLNVNTIGNMRKMTELLIDPANSNKLVCSTDIGVFISTDAGANWTQTLNDIHIRDLRLKPGDGSVVYGVSSTAFYRSTDGGASFTQVTSGVPTNTFRMVIDVTPANANYVYIFSSDATDNREHGIFRSTDSGQSFSTREIDSYTLIGNNQVWYNMAMGVSDTNANELYVGVMDVWKSTNGGQQWDKLNRWDQLTEAYTHADIHGIRVVGGKVYVVSDGGIYSSTDGGVNFSPHYQDLQIGEFFNVAIAEGDPDNISGGTQDNGGFGLDVVGDWRGYHPGDGVNTLITPTDPNTYYGFIQNGGTLYVSNQGDGWFTRVFKPGGAGNGVWVTPLSADGNGDVFAAWDNLYKLDRVNYQWQLVGSLGGYTDIMEIAPSDPNRIVSSGHQNLRISYDGGQTLGFNNNVVGNSIAGIAIHPSNPDIMWITTDGDYQNKGIFKTTDGGQTWIDITGNFPVATEYPEEIVYQSNHSQNPIYVSTDLGVYRLDDSSPDWEPFMVGLPNTKIEDLEIDIEDGTLTAGTYGRGIWRTYIPIETLDDDIRLLSVGSPSAGGSSTCGAFQPQIEVRNNGSNPITSIDISFDVDGGTTENFTWTGNLLTFEQATIDLPELSLPSGSHTLNVTVTIPNDGNLSNNSRSQGFSIAAEGILNSVNTFESSSDELTIVNGVWQRGVPTGGVLNTAASGTQVYGTNLSGDYPTSVNAYLVTNCYDFTTIQNPVLKFQMAYNLEQDWDWANVEYSLNGGQNWYTLGTVNSQPNWYNSSQDGNGYGCPGCPGAQWLGTNATLTEYAYDFVANAMLGETDLTQADNIVFRLGLRSDNVITEEGIIVDDLVVEGTQNVATVSPKVFLQGSVLDPNVGEESWMRDDLRVAGSLPTISPYAENRVIASSSVFAATGADAIVDWVLVELRNVSDNTQVLASRSAFVQRDGDVVDIDGVSTLQFGLPSGNYYIAIKHRNHLGIMTAATVSLGNTTTVVDFTDANNVITYGSHAQTTYGMPTNVLGMWAGDANGDGQIIFLNTGAESVNIKQTVLDVSGSESPFGPSVFYKPNGYYNVDLNMDEEVIFLNAGNELLMIKDNVLAHPSNQIFNSVFFTITEQLP